MDDHLGDLGALAADSLLDRARERVCLLKLAPGLEREGQEDGQPVVRLEEPELSGRAARLLPHDPEHGLRVTRDLDSPGLPACGRLGKRLEVRPNRVHLR